MFYRDGRVSEKVDPRVASDIVKAFAYAGDSQLALQTLDRINNAYFKAHALGELAVSYVKLRDKEKANALFSDQIKTVERFGNSEDEAIYLGTIAVSVGRFGEKERARSLLLQGIKKVEQISARGSQSTALRRIALSYAELGETTKDSALIEEALKTADRIGDDRDKRDTLIAIAKSYAGLGDKEKARALLGKIPEQSINFAVVESYTELGDGEKARALLKWIKEEHSSDEMYLMILAPFYDELSETMKDSALLEETIETSKRVSLNENDSYGLIALALSYAKLGETKKDRAWIDEALKTAERINNRRDSDKLRVQTEITMVLNEIAMSYARLGETMKDSALLEDAIKIAERTDIHHPSSEHAQSEVVRIYVKFAESSNDPILFLRDNVLKRPLPNSCKNQALDAILPSKSAIADVGRLRSLTSHYGDDRGGRAEALAIILMAVSRPDLIEKEKNSEKAAAGK
jgi:tetratricopeptide (TPR) repeat protein